MEFVILVPCNISVIIYMEHKALNSMYNEVLTNKGKTGRVLVLSRG